MSNPKNTAFTLNGDPVTQQSEWDPMAPGGIHWRTRNLVFISDTRLEFVASGSSILWGIGCTS